jgi:hypothetical protein
MKLLRGITNLFKNKNTHFCPTDPFAFFSSESVSELIDAFNATAPNAIGHSSIDTLAFKISETSKYDYVIIARLKEENKFSAISICDQSNIFRDKDFEFDLDFPNTTAGKYVPQNIHPEKTFNHITCLKFKAKSATALLIHDNDKAPIGAVIGITKSKNSKTLSNILKFFSYNLAK